MTEADVEVAMLDWLALSLSARFESRLKELT